MSYHPQAHELDFEMGAFGDRLKKVAKKVGKGIGKFTEYTIVKPSAAIGGAIGGKKGRALGRKLGKLTQKVTHLGIGAGAAGIAPTLTTAVAAGTIGKKIAKKLKAKKKTKTSKKAKPFFHKIKAPPKTKKPSCDNAQAAAIGALLVKKLGGPLSSANKALKLAELQRQATYEHNKLMNDDEFRKRVLAGITSLASAGDLNCERTVRVLVGR